MVDTYSGMELCTPTWLNHDHGDGGVVDISVVDAYFRMEVYTPIYLIQKIFKTEMDTSLNKAQHNKSYYVDNIWLS
jgi:hypothetical protein